MRNFRAGAAPFLSFVSLFLASMIGGTPVRASSAADHIGSIDGASFVEVRDGQSVRRAKGGDSVAPGEIVRTGLKTTATVRCPDGTVLIIGRNSALTIEENVDSSRAVRVNRGVVRAIVSKINFEHPTVATKFRFYMKTRSATMGVRGTDFVCSVDASSATMDLYTLEGTVSVAKDVPTLLRTGGVSVVGGYALTATPGKIGEPRAFDPKLLAQQFSESQPGMGIQESTPSTLPNPRESATPPSVKKPGWIQKTSFVKGDQVYFVGAVSNAANLEEGRKEAADAAYDALRSYLKSNDLQGITLEMRMSYEEKTGSTYKVFRLTSIPLKTIENFKASHSGK